MLVSEPKENAMFLEYLYSVSARVRFLPRVYLSRVPSTDSAFTTDLISSALWE